MPSFPIVVSLMVKKSKNSLSVLYHGIVQHSLTYPRHGIHASMRKDDVSVSLPTIYF